MSAITLRPGELRLADLRGIYRGARGALDGSCRAGVDLAAQTVARIVASGRTVYGVNTGFGQLARKTIAPDQLGALQTNLILSPSAGTGAPLEDATVRLIL